MDNLIVQINELRKCIDEFNISGINIPQVIVIGSQSSGKSSVLERIIHCDILPKDSQLATRCPIILELIHKENNEDITAYFDDKTHEIGAVLIQKKLQEITNKIKINKKGISESPIRIQMHGKSFPTLTLVDLPGMIKNDSNLPEGSVSKILELTESYASSSYSIILAISAANNDLANSDSIQVSKKFDPNGERTFHVITKIDIMDKGTTATELLENNLLKPSLGVCFLVNRSQQNINEKIDMKLTDENERKYLEENYPKISPNHGINRLIQKVVEKLRQEIKINLPTISQEIRSKRREIEEKLVEIDKTRNVKNLDFKINKFIDKYAKIIRGDKNYCFDKLVGGALISDILYNQYKKDIEMLFIAERQDNELHYLIKNTTGNRKTAFSIEKPFRFLVEKENEKFLKPTSSALEKITMSLKDFKIEAINEINIESYPNLKKWLNDKMYELIETRYKKTKEICENILRCEKNHTFSPQPDLSDHSKRNKKDSDDKTDSINFEAKDHLTDEEKKQSTDFTDIILTGAPIVTNDLRVAAVCGIFKFLKNNYMIYTDIMKKCEVNADLSILMIRRMRDEYFQDMKNYLIENVPKWIQTFMIDDLIEDMKSELYNYDEKEKEKLKQLDSNLENKAKEYKDQNEKLKEIEKELNKGFQ